MVRLVLEEWAGEGVAISKRGKFIDPRADRRPMPHAQPRRKTTRLRANRSVRARGPRPPRASRPAPPPPPRGDRACRRLGARPPPAARPRPVALLQQMLRCAFRWFVWVCSCNAPTLGQSLASAAPGPSARPGLSTRSSPSEVHFATRLKTSLARADATRRCAVTHADEVRVYVTTFPIEGGGGASAPSGMRG